MLIKENNTDQRLNMEMEYFKIRMTNTMSSNKISAILDEILNSQIYPDSRSSQFTYLELRMDKI